VFTILIDFVICLKLQEINGYRGSLGMLYAFDWISVPLVYTQVNLHVWYLLLLSPCREMGALCNDTFVFFHLFVCRLKRVLVGHWPDWPGSAILLAAVSSWSAAGPVRHTLGGGGLSCRQFGQNWLVSVLQCEFDSVSVHIVYENFPYDVFELSFEGIKINSFVTSMVNKKGR